MRIHKFTFNPFQENTYIIANNNDECIIVDPGCYSNHEFTEINQFISEHNLKVLEIIATHCHLDHIFGAKTLCEKYGTTFRIPENEVSTLQAAPNSASFFGIPGLELPEFVNDLKVGPAKLGSDTFEIIAAPGHSIGHVVFYIPQIKSLIGGDVLFQGSIGRTDLPGGNFETLEKSIQEKIYTLPEDTVVYPGHGDNTEIGIEKRTNPFVKAKA